MELTLVNSGMIGETLITQPDELERKISKTKGSQIDRPFISCDLETYKGNDGRAEIMHFGFSNGRSISGQNLSIDDCLEVIRAVGIDNSLSKPIYIGFGFRYEVTFFLRDMPWKLAEKLWKGRGRNTAITWHNCRFEYLKGKYFQISKGGKKDETTPYWSVRIYECFSWFNTNLVDAAKKHISHTKHWRKHGEFITASKSSRQSFTFKDLRKVVKYWEVEQETLVILMDHIRNLIVNAGLPLPSHWWGPSALTAACFRHYGVKEHMTNEQPDDFIMACRFAYYGGRFEQFKAGKHQGPIYQYDIASAYPFAMIDLWSFNDSRLEYCRDSKQFDWSPFTLYHIRYKTEKQFWENWHSPHPFPFRDLRGQIFFPGYVETWLWGPELEHYWNDGEISFLDCWRVIPGEQKPFKWISELFELRCELKKNGNPAEYVVKITINSAYGKTAQRVGWNEEKFLPPEFHNLAWAGYITSKCRAMVWNATLLSNGGVFQIETDAVFSTTEIDLPQISGKNLPTDIGRWERTEYEGIITLQNGIYWTKKDGFWKKPKFRGMRKGATGIDVTDADEFLKRLDITKRKTIPMQSQTIAFYGNGHRGSNRYLKWLPEDKITHFAGEGKRFWLGIGNPSESLIPLTNGITREMKEYGYDGIRWHSYPHHLPWALSEIALEIEIAESQFCDYDE